MAHGPACLLGLVLAIPAHKFFLSFFVLDFIGTLVHELGHVAAAFAFGRIAIPALYLDGGGKAAVIFDPGIFGPIALGTIGLGVAIFLLEGRARIIALIALVVYFALGLTRGRDVVLVAGGHLGEMAWIAFALGMCLIRRGGSGAERILYGVSAWFLWIDRMKLFWVLRKSPNERIAYFNGGAEMGTVSDLLELSLSKVGSFEAVSFAFTALGVLVVLLVCWSAWTTASDS